MAKGDTANKKEVEKRNDVWEVTQYAKQELIEKMKADLPKYIKKRKKEFVKKLEEYELMQPTDNDENAIIMNKTIPMLELTDFCFTPFVKIAGEIINYSADEFMCIFDYFKQCIKEMNKTEIIPPTREQFCQLCGISTARFNELKSSGSKEVREVLEQVNDWICNYLSIGGLTRKISEVSSIYQQKVLGRKEATDTPPAPQTNNIVIGDSAFAELYNKYITKK